MGRPSSVVSIASDAHSSEAESHSTMGTTASLSSRIASLALDQHYGLRDLADGLSSVGGTSEGFPASIYECSEDGERAIAEGPEGEDGLYAYGEEEEEEEEEEVVEMTEAEMLEMLDSAENPFQVCSRLFRVSQPLDPICSSLAHLRQEHVQHLLETGFVVWDDFISQDAAAGLRQSAMHMSDCGDLRPAAELDAGEHFSDRSARSDLLRFVHPGRDCSAVESVLQRLQELQDDLRHVVHLRRQQAEYQLAHYKGDGSFYKRHRDALPCGDTEDDQRRVTIIVYTNAGWDEAQGGALRLWLPQRPSPLAAGTEQGTIRIRDLRVGSAGASPATEVHLQADSSSEGQQPNGSRAPAGLPIATNGGGNGHQADHDTHSLDSHSVDSSCSHGRAVDLAAALPHVRLHEDSAGASVCTVAPLAGRVVVFLSGCVDHEVLPSFCDRIALTAWCQ